MFNYNNEVINYSFYLIIDKLSKNGKGAFEYPNSGIKL